MAQRDHHLLALDQVFHVVLELGLAQHGAPIVRELLPCRDQLRPQDGAQPLAVLQDVDVVLDLLHDPGELVRDLVPLHGGEPLQAQLQDRPRLLVGEPAGAGLGHLLAGIGDQRDQRARVHHRPVAAGEARAGLGGVLGLADQRDDLVDVGDGDGEARERVRPRPRLGKLVRGAPRDDLLAEVDEGRDDVLERQQLRPPAAQRQHVDPETRLQRRVAVELVEHHLRHRAPLELDDDAHAVAVRFVAEVGDPLDAALVHEPGDALDHPRLVHLVGDLP